MEVRNMKTNNNTESVITIYVSCLEPLEVKGHKQTVMMVPFSGTAEGSGFTGKVVGTGYDTQKIMPDGTCLLSARYILEGTDSTGAYCKIFIENESCEDGIIRPQITTDSSALAFLEDEKMHSEIESVDGGVVIRIFLDK